MWRRVIATQIRSLRSAPPPRRANTLTPFTPHISRHFSNDSGNVGDKKVGEVKPIGTEHTATDPSMEEINKKIDEVHPIATGRERLEMEFELQGKNILEGFNDCTGPFGTEEKPAIIKSYYNARIVGCVGDSSDHEHDVLWFWLREGEKHVCPYCDQVFMLQVDGPGEHPPDGPDRPSSDDEIDGYAIDNDESEGHKLS